MTYSMLNSHLDRCLTQAARRTATSTVPTLDPASPSGTSVNNKRGKLKAEDETPTESLKRQRTEDGVHEMKKSAALSGPLNYVSAAMPLAERLRPRSLDEFVGQSEIVDGPLKQLLRAGTVPSCILWGPPGTGKTTLARLLTKAASGPTNNQSTSKPSARFIELSATSASVAEVKKIFDESLNRLKLSGQRTILFLDEVQRFSRAQQDIFLPPVEKGHIVLIAATTENPSFRMQSALISRMRVFVLKKLSVEDCVQVLQNARARAAEMGYRAASVSEAEEGGVVYLDDVMLEWIAQTADGDARSALSTFEIALAVLGDADDGEGGPLSQEAALIKLKEALKRTSLAYDRSGDMHYDTISALHKSIRGSDPDAAMYWLARMVCSGDDPLFIARRLIVAASEDCNTLEALQMANATYQACNVVGLPECAENLAQTVLFLAESSKSTRAYRAWKKAEKLVMSNYNYPVPLHIRNAPTKLMKNLDYGKEYRYEPSFAHPIHQEFFPPELKGTRLVSPPPLERQHSGNDVEALLQDGPADSSSRGHVATTSAAAQLSTSDGVGPGSCQRIFQIGARAVDLDLLAEWERERNDGHPWEGRERLMASLASRTTQDKDGHDES